MKYLVVLVIAFAALVAADEEWKPTTERETFHKIHDDCIKESGASAEQVQKINDLEHPDDKEGHEYIHCAATKLGIFSDDKGYNLERLMSQFTVMFVDVEQVRDIVTNCVDSNEQKSTPVEWAFRGHKCLMDGKIGEILKKSKAEAEKKTK